MQEEAPSPPQIRSLSKPARYRAFVDHLSKGRRTKPFSQRYRACDPHFKEVMFYLAMTAEKTTHLPLSGLSEGLNLVPEREGGVWSISLCFSSHTRSQQMGKAVGERNSTSKFLSGDKLVNTPIRVLVETGRAQSSRTEVLICGLVSML